MPLTVRRAVSGSRRSGARGRANRRNDPVEVGVGQVAAARQTQAAREEIVGDGPAADREGAEDRLEVHRLPDVARLDVLRFEVLADGLAAGAEPGCVDG